MTTEWTISIDWDRDGSYTGTYDDVTERVMEAKWQLGMTVPYQLMAGEATLTLVLRNTDGLYSPENGNSPLTGKMQFLKAAETSLALQEDKRTDEIIAELIQEVVFPPALSNVCILGRVGNAELGQTTYLVSPSGYSDLEQGTLTLSMAADN